MAPTIDTIPVSRCALPLHLRIRDRCRRRTQHANNQRSGRLHAGMLACRPVDLQNRRSRRWQYNVSHESAPGRQPDFSADGAVLDPYLTPVINWIRSVRLQFKLFLWYSFAWEYWLWWSVLFTPCAASAACRSRFGQARSGDIARSISCRRRSCCADLPNRLYSSRASLHAALGDRCAAQHPHCGSAALHRR